MKKNILISIISILILLTGFALIKYYKNDLKREDEKQEEELIIKKDNILKTIITSKNTNEIIVQDKNNIIYNFDIKDDSLKVGDYLLIEYEGTLNKNKTNQDVKIVSYNKEERKQTNDINELWLDNGLFKNYYVKANNTLKNMTLEEKIGQIFLVRYPTDKTAVSIQNTYQFGGYLFFKKDFNNKTEQQAKTMINNVQNASKIPMLTAVDEEGGIVVRVSSNSNLSPSKHKSPRALYLEGGFDLIKQDTITKSNMLYNLGLNLNLAPVVDISTSEKDYMYKRSLGENKELTAKYAKTVIEASKNTNVSYTLKHFPGYGNNIDTHTGIAIDNRTYQSILDNDLLPFKEGIDSLAEAVLVSHNIVTSIDENNQSSLSPSIHNLLRNELGFTGIIITDDLDMGAIDNVEEATIKAILAGNDLIITTDYKTSINAVKKAINNNTISEELIDKLAFRVLSWKYYKGMIK